MHARSAALVAGFLGAAAAAPAATADKDRPLPGFAGLSYRDVPLAHGCVPQIRVVKRSRKVDDPELVTLLTWPRLTGLDFDPDDPVRQRTSLRRFQEWFQRLSAQARKVGERQAAIVRDGARPAVTRVEEAARLALAQQQMASLIGSLAVPPSVRKHPEAADAYCDLLFEYVEPLEQQAAQTRERCRQLAADAGVGAGWWDAVCAGPAP
jgi:hypothetical protein